MENRTIRNIELCFLKLLLDEQNYSNGYKLIVQNSGWSTKLPDEYKNQQFIELDIKNWTHEETIVDNEYIHLVVVFSDLEYRVSKKFHEIQAIATLEKEIIFQKPYNTMNFNEDNSVTIKDLEVKIDLSQGKSEKELQKSKEMILSKNPQFKKGK